MIPSANHRLAPTEDSFDPWQYRQELAELRRLFSRLLPYQSPQKARMVISFLRHHTLHTPHMPPHAPLASAIMNSQHDTQGLQQLFDNHRGNEAFCKDLEAYIAQWLP